MMDKRLEDLELGCLVLLSFLLSPSAKESLSKMVRIVHLFSCNLELQSIPVVSDEEDSIFISDFEFALRFFQAVYILSLQVNCLSLSRLFHFEFKSYKKKLVAFKGFQFVIQKVVEQNG